MPKNSPSNRTETCLRTPDLFSGIMSPEVRINPLYPKVKPKAELWFKEYGGTSNGARHVAKVLLILADVSSGS